MCTEGFLGRSTATNDALLQYAAGEDQDNYSMQRITEGNPGLTPELGENESYGIVIEPADGMIFTMDWWSIETEDTIGIFGMTNAILLDTLIRAEGGPSECVGNPNVTRTAYAGYDFAWPSSLCPAGEVQSVNDYYVNTDTNETTWDKPEELMTEAEIANQGEWLWIPDEQNVYIPAKLCASKGKKHRVDIDGIIKTVKAKDCLSCNKYSMLRVVSDLTLLDEMSEPLSMAF